MGISMLGALSDTTKIPANGYKLFWCENKKMKKVIVSFILCFVLVGMASASTENWNSDWDGEGTGNLWSTAENWSTVPTGKGYIGEGTEIVPPSYNRGSRINGAAAVGSNGPVINSDVGPIDMFILGQFADLGGSPTCTMTDGGSLTVTGTVLFGHNVAASPILYVNGGTLTFEKVVQNSWGSATIDMSGNGTLNCQNGLKLGTNGRGTSRINMTGGTINTTYLTIPVGPGTRKAFLNLYGGTIDVGSALTMGVDSHIDIRNNGKLIISGNQVNTIKGYANSGWITGYDIGSQVSIVFDGSNTIVTATDPMLAYNPQPDNGETGVEPDSNLSWTASSDAASHDVYLGTNPTPGAGEFRGNQPGTSYGPPDPLYPLELETTYYWRIDERNSSGQLQWGPGAVWSFSTRPPKPSIIVRESEYEALRARASQSPWSNMKTAAISDAGTLTYDPGITPYGKGKCMRLRDIVSSNALAYILDPDNKTGYKNKIRDQLNTGLDDLISTFPGSWDSVPLGCMLMNATLAMDIIYSDLTPGERSIIEGKMEYLVGVIREWWLPAPQAVRATWALYKGDTAGFESNRIEYTEFLHGFFTDDGVFTDGNGYAVARLGFHERQQKSLFMDILEKQGYDDFYSADKVRKGHEYLYGYSVTPFGRSVTFGDTSPNDMLWHYTSAEYPSNASTQLYRAYQFGDKAGRYAAWRLENNIPWGRLLAYILTEQSPSSSPELAPSRIFPDGGAFFVESAQSTQALFGGLWNPTFHEDNHAHKEINAIAMAAYGEHVLRNAGYKGWRAASHGFSWEYINQSAHSGNTVMINGEDHVSKDGAGITEGFTGLGVDYASGDSGSALPNGHHQRNLVFVQPADGVNGYWILFDEVDADNPSDNASLNLHPHSNGITEVSSRKEYQSLIGPYTYSGHDVYITIFLGTEPESMLFKDGLLASWSGESFVGKYLYSTYDTDAGGKCNIVTILFPHDATHAKASMTRVSSANYTGASITQGSIKDIALESSGAGVVTYGNVSFKGLACWYRLNSGSSTSYFVRKGTAFDDGSSPRVGFESNGAVSIHLEGGKGRIVSPGTLVTFYYPQITGVKENGQSLTIVDSGTDWVQVNISSGTHEIETVLAARPSRRP